MGFGGAKGGGPLDGGEEAKKNVDIFQKKMLLLPGALCW